MATTHETIIIRHCDRCKRKVDSIRLLYEYGVGRYECIAELCTDCWADFEQFLKLDI